MMMLARKLCRYLTLGVSGMGVAYSISRAINVKLANCAERVPPIGTYATYIKTNDRQTNLVLYFNSNLVKCKMCPNHVVAP